MSIAAIDIGNSNTKIKIVNQPIIVINNQELLNNSLQLNSGEQLITQAVLSSVASDRDTFLIMRYLSTAYNFTKFEQWPSEKILSYALPEQAAILGYLGSDRALRIYHLSQLDPTQVQIGVGCGSAFTIEIIHQHQLIESIILPGLSLQLNSLSANTAKLPAINSSEIVNILNNHAPLSTTYAIIHGILSSYLALIESLISRHQPQTVICSGGYSELLQQNWRNQKQELTIYKYLEVVTLSKLAADQI